MQHEGARTHLSTIFNDAGFEVGQVPDQAIVANGGRPFQSGVHDGSILNAGAGPNANLAVITAQHGSRPHAGLRTDENRTNDHGVRVNKSRGIDGGLL